MEDLFHPPKDATSEHHVGTLSLTWTCLCHVLMPPSADQTLPRAGFGAELDLEGEICSVL